MSQPIQTTIVVQPNKRSIILPGVAADKFYDFSVRAYRAVDKDIAADGVIYSDLARAKSLRYRPTDVIAFSGDVTGTIRGVETTQIVADLNGIISDNILSRGEKPTIVLTMKAAIAAYDAARSKANQLGGVDTYINAADAAMDALKQYLADLNPAFDDMRADTLIDASQFQAAFAAMAAAQADLDAMIADRAAQLAVWNGITGPGKPQDNATVGAPVGTNVGGVPVVDIVDAVSGLDGRVLKIRDIEVAVASARSEVAAARSEIATVKTDLSQDVASARKDVADARTELDQVSSSLSGEIARAKDDAASIRQEIVNVKQTADGAGAAVSDEAIVRAREDSSLAGRISTTESQFRGDQDSVLAGRIRDEATTRANQDSAIAGRMTTVEASSRGAGNMLPNTDFASADGWSLTHNGMELTWNNATGGYWHPPGEYVLQASRSGAAPANTFSEMRSVPFSVQSGERIQFYGRTASHRSKSWCSLFFFDEAGRDAGYTGEIFAPNYDNGGPDVGGWDYTGLKSFRVPSNAVSAVFAWRIYEASLGEANPAGWLFHPYVGSAREGQTEWNAFTHGSPKGSLQAVNARVTDEASARATEDSALAGRIRDEATARAQNDGALAGRISTVEATAKNIAASFTAVSRGGSAPARGGRGAGIYNVDGANFTGGGRGWRVNVFNSSNALIASNLYDTLAGDRSFSLGGAAEMASFLNGISEGQAVIITTDDEPRDNRMTAGLLEAMQRVGAGPKFTSTQFAYRGAYILIGQAGIGAGNGIEAYAGTGDSAADAWVERRFDLLNGRPVLNGAGASIIETNAAVKDEATTRANADSAIAGRVSTVEASYSASGNLLDNTEFAVDSTGWSFVLENGTGAARDGITGKEWWPANTHALVMAQENTNTGRGGYWYQDVWGIDGGNPHQASMYAASHRANLLIYLDYYDSAGAIVGTTSSTPIMWQGNGANAPLGVWQRHVLNFTPPKSADRVRFMMMKQGTNAGGNSYAWFIKPQLVRTRSGVTDIVPYMPGGTSGPLVASDARITDEATTRANADSAVAGRVSETEAKLNGVNDSALAGRIRDEATARAQNDSALAGRISTTEAQFRGEQASALKTLIDANRKNYAVVDWWKKGAGIPWVPNGGQRNEIVEFPHGGNFDGLPMPDGSSGDAWLCQADASGGAAGGWNAGQTAPLDPDKTYRYIVPIAQLGDGGRTSYWGTGGVCTLNTQSLADNPYWAIASSATMTRNRWYLFVGFIFPRNSAGKSHTGSGVWDMVTGAKVADGASYCFHPDGRTPDHRAYQYYASAGAYQAFGRPVIELVDGNETNIMGALTSLRKAVSADARVTDEATTRANQDSALAGRINTTESMFALGTDSSLYARLRTEETTRANQDSALSSRTSTVEAQVSNDSNNLVRNGIFNAPGWGPSTNGYPPNWGGWINDTGAFIGTASRPSKYGASAPLQIDRNGDNNGVMQLIPGPMAAGWYVFEIDIDGESGVWAGSGFHINFANGYSRNFSFGTEADTNGEVISGGADRNRKFSTLFYNGALAPGGANVYLMAGWTGFTGRGGYGFFRTIWHRVIVRSASEAEIKAQKADSTLGALQARVSTTESAISGLNGKVAAYWQVDAVAGNNRAQMRVHADANGGAGVDIVGDTTFKGNLEVTGNDGSGNVLRMTNTLIQMTRPSGVPIFRLGTW